MNYPYLQPYIKLSASIFFIALLMGYLAAKSYLKESVDYLDQMLSDYDFLRYIGSFGLFLIIFLNNSIKSFIAMLCGIFFGLVPFFFLYLNGFLIGLFIYITSRSMGLLGVILSILPHGIFELWAIMISTGIGLWLGAQSFRRLRYKVPLQPSIKIAVRIYVSRILPMLLFAAAIEAYISVLVAGFFRQ